MPTDSNTPPNAPSAGQQRRQAGRLLLRLQGLLILVLIIALVWLYLSQQRFEQQVNDRLQSNEQVITRLNEMDDRLFAISQQTAPPPAAVVGSQAQNQLELLRIQIQAADSLLADDDDQAAIDLLRGLQWQLSQKSNEIAPALTIVLKQSLNKDIERLQAQSTQPSPWQLQNLAIQNIQTFLHGHEQSSSQNSNRQVTRDVKNKARATEAQAHNTVAMTRQQLTIHEAIMTLNLAMQASNMREKDQLVSYLAQARSQLQTLTATTAKAPTVDNNQQQNSTAVTDPDTDMEGDAPSDQTPPNLANMDTPKSLSEILTWLDQLIAAAPTPTPLLTTQILDQPKR